MRLYRTIFEILLLIFQKIKRSRDSDHAPFGDNLSSIGWDLLCSTHILSLKCLQLPVTKKLRATPNVKILVLSHHLGDLGVTYTIHLWLAGKHAVDFLLVLIEFFSLALMAVALLIEIGGLRGNVHGSSMVRWKACGRLPISAN